MIPWDRTHLGAEPVSHLTDTVETCVDRLLFHLSRK